MKKLIFIACDTDKISEVKNIIAQTSNNKFNIGYKFGLEFLTLSFENFFWLDLFYFTL